MANVNVITTAALIEKFQQALDDHWGYIWGTAGVMWTAAKQQQLEQTTDSDRANSRKYGTKWIGHMVADCSGLFAWAFRQLGGSIAHGSNSIWDRYCSSKGELRNGKREDGQPLIPGTAVFTYNKVKKNRGHIGLYVGGGLVIEAKGAYYGVVTSKVTDSKWVEWGELKGVDYSVSVPDPADDPEPVKSRPTIRKGNKNQYVTECQKMLQALGYNLGICGVDGDFGTATDSAVKAFQKDHDGPDGHALKVDGIVGPATWWALEQATEDQKPEPVKLYTVTISGLTEDKATAITQQYGGVISAE